MALEEMAGAIRSLLVKLGVTKSEWAICGHSLGGAVALLVTELTATKPLVEEERLPLFFLSIEGNATPEGVAWLLLFVVVGIAVLALVFYCLRTRVCPPTHKMTTKRRTLETVDVVVADVDVEGVDITEDSVPAPPRKTASMTLAMSRALSRKLSGKAVSFTEEGSALVEGDGADGVAEDDDVVIEDLPMPARRSLTTRSFSVRTSDGSSDGGGGGAGGGGGGHAALALPPNWEAHEDEQGNIFFYNTLTEEVRWEAP